MTCECCKIGERVLGISVGINIWRLANPSLIKYSDSRMSTRISTKQQQSNIDLIFTSLAVIHY